jgi:hypothetical protein
VLLPKKSHSQDSRRFGRIYYCCNTCLIDARELFLYSNALFLPLPTHMPVKLCSKERIYYALDTNETLCPPILMVIAGDSMGSVFEPMKSEVSHLSERPRWSASLVGLLGDSEWKFRQCIYLNRSCEGSNGCIMTEEVSDSRDSHEWLWHTRIAACS